MSTIWQVLIPVYLAGGILYALQNMRSNLFKTSAKALEQSGLSWTAIPMIFLSAVLWPLWLVSGYLVKWWLIRKIDSEDADDA